MDSAVSGLVGAAIGAGALLIAQFLASWHQRRAAKDEWLRNKLAEIYEGALSHLHSQEYGVRDRWLNLLLIYFPVEEDEARQAFVSKVRRGAVRASDIVQLALSDSRLGRESLPKSKVALLAPPDED